MRAGEDTLPDEAASMAEFGVTVRDRPKLRDQVVDARDAVVGRAPKSPDAPADHAAALQASAAIRVSGRGLRRLGLRSHLPSQRDRQFLILGHGCRIVWKQIRWIDLESRRA